MNRPAERVHTVRNRSARTGGAAAIKAIALHTTESHPRPGHADIDGVLSWFDNPASQASSHVIVDDEGNAARCVGDRDKAWTIGVFNSATLNIEMIGFAATPRWRWLKRRRQLRKVAEYVAYWAARWDIPIQRGQLGSDRGRPVVKRKGIVCHSDATAAGFGTHTDPGKGFPVARVIDLARRR